MFPTFIKNSDNCFCNFMSEFYWQFLRLYLFSSLCSMWIEAPTRARCKLAENSIVCLGWTKISGGSKYDPSLLSFLKLPLRARVFSSQLLFDDDFPHELSHERICFDSFVFILCHRSEIEFALRFTSKQNRDEKEWCAVCIM